jgi:hypothetical protein
MARKKALEQLETIVNNTEVTFQAIWPIVKFLLRDMDQGHQLPFMVLQVLSFIHPRKPTQLLTAWKISSHTMICEENHERRVEAPP